MTEGIGPARAIGGFQVVESTAAGLIATLRRRRDEGRVTELMFANTNFVVTCHGFADRLHGPETLIVNDGIGLDLASRLFYRRPFVENLAGTDFVPRLFASLDRPTRVFLLGARPASVQGAARVWGALPNITIVGTVDGYAGMADADRVNELLASSRPDILFVALGDPRQARWIVAHREHHAIPLVIAGGAVFDFAAGAVSRAPRFVRQLRLEWAYRLIHEPRRLVRRYTLDLIVFFAHCVKTHRALLRARA